VVEVAGWSRHRSGVIESLEGLIESRTGKSGIAPDDNFELRPSGFQTVDAAPNDTD
jgi:hypothetical protein